MAWQCFAEELPLPTCIETATWTDGDVQCNSLYDVGEEVDGAILAISGRHRSALFFVVGASTFVCIQVAFFDMHSLSKAGSMMHKFLSVCCQGVCA